MSTDNCTYSLGTDRFCQWIIPEALVHNELSKFYKDYPIGSRLLAGVIGLINGTLKPLLFPIMCAVGVVAMPIIAAVQLARGEKEDACEWMKAWVFCVLGAAATLGFVTIMTFYLPLTATAVIMTGFIAFSIVIHVYKLVKEPPPPIVS